MKSLKYIIHDRISNLATKAIAQQAVGGTTYQQWPGTLFSLNTANGQALLGSPNGAGNFYLLTQRRDAFPGKTIESLGVFSDDYDDLCLVFRFST